MIEIDIDMKTHIIIRLLEECFGPSWFSFDKAWKEAFSAHNEGERMRRNDALRRLEELADAHFLERSKDSDHPIKYRLDARAGTFRNCVPQEVETAPKAPGRLSDRMIEYESALEKGDRSIIDDPIRVAEWKRYRHLKKLWH